jgi:hypothetical protein
MTERREVVVGSALQHHQVHQLLTQYGIEHADEPIGTSGARFTFVAADDQWMRIDQWLQRIGVQS